VSFSLPVVRPSAIPRWIGARWRAALIGPRPAGGGYVDRQLALLEDDCAEAVTISELRERAIEAPAQAIYTLQLTGYEIDRVPIQRPKGRNTTGYRLRLQASQSSDQREVIDDGL
jgi:hypothetical protein